jgi:phosphomannomutase
MHALKIGIGGVRGMVGQTFTPELVVGFAQAFSSYLDAGRILVCRDTRPSGPMVTAAVMSGLLASGCEPIDLGVCPTPSLQLAVPWLEAHGGISITAGHNAAPWNALKFVRGDGLYLNAGQAEELLDIYHQGEFQKASWRQIRPHIEPRDVLDHHLARLAASFDVDAIRKRHLRVAVDCCNGACALLSPRWLAHLGCEVLVINDDPTAAFPHSPEPRIETAAQVRALVKAGHADIGFVHDADGERLAIVDETGRPLSEELTLVLAARITLARTPGTVVTNVSTTAALERVAATYGATIVRTPVGQAYVSEAILETGAVLGGEGNGAVAVPRVLASHDSTAAIGLLLEYLAGVNTPLSALVDDLPALVMVKRQVEIAPHLIYTALQAFRERMDARPEGEIDQTDGIKVSWPDGWVHLRASNTESIIRIIAEAETTARANDLADWAQETLRR